MDEIITYFPELTSQQKDLLAAYAGQLATWNTRINLISRQATAQMTERHILHSLAIAKWIQFVPGTKILDLGTGGGLPGIPLAICFPECGFTLIDSRGKKIEAVRQMSQYLGLQNVNAKHIRAEEAGGTFDFVVTRAVAGLSELMTWSAPLLDRPPRTSRSSAQLLYDDGQIDEKNISGGLIALKGGDLSDEIQELQKRNREKYEIHTISIHRFFSDPFFIDKYVVFIPV